MRKICFNSHELSLFFSTLTPKYLSILSLSVSSKFSAPSKRDFIKILIYTFFLLKISTLSTHTISMRFFNTYTIICRVQENISYFKSFSKFLIKIIVTLLQAVDNMLKFQHIRISIIEMVKFLWNLHIDCYFQLYLQKYQYKVN